MSDDSLEVAAARLYGLLPGEFTAARTAAAADAGRARAAEIRALRKPSTAAWVVNALARGSASRLSEALELADRLREAQDDLDAATLSRLGRERRALVAALAHDAAELAEARGVTVSAAVAADVERTLNAAMRDAAAAAAVSSGRLVRALEASGLDPVDLDGAVGGSLDLLALGRQRDVGARSSAPQRGSDAPTSAGAAAGGASAGAAAGGAAGAAAGEAEAGDELAERRGRREAERAARAAEKAAREVERARKDAERELARIDSRLQHAREHADRLLERVEGMERELDRVRAAAADAVAEVERLDVQRRVAASALPVTS
jgi:hypothetical protein